jgi:hypothetical protein
VPTAEVISVCYLEPTASGVFGDDLKSAIEACDVCVFGDAGLQYVNTLLEQVCKGAA